MSKNKVLFVLSFLIAGAAFAKTPVVQVSTQSAMPVPPENVPVDQRRITQETYYCKKHGYIGATAFVFTASNPSKQDRVQICGFCLVEYFKKHIGEAALVKE